MADAMIDQVLGDQHDAIVVAVQAQMRGEPTMDRVAAKQQLSTSDLASQVTGFWLQAIRTDLALGTTATMAQNMGWLVNLRTGHDLPFDNAMVLRMFDAISAEIDARLGSDDLRQEYAAYRDKVAGLIVAAFPQ